MESITLYYKEGSSDKVYTASIEPFEDKYRVNFAYGRRNTTLQTGTKTPVPVSYNAAKTIFDKLVREKQAKGYTAGENGTPYGKSENAGGFTGILPQLLNPIEDHQVHQFINDPAYWMQEKMDGKRLLLRKEGDNITGINRKGLEVDLPETMVKSARQSTVDFIMDGEAVGDAFWVFDLLSIGTQDLRQMRYAERSLRLSQLLVSSRFPYICSVNTAYLARDKKELFAELKAHGREGVVFKHIEAPYTPGRPASGGSQLKFKFWNTASFIVSEINDKRSVSLMLHREGRQVTAGNVTIPPNHESPTVGQVVECRYLYAFKQSGCIYQPIYLGARDDIPKEECTVDQLKWKPG
jgi:bifunctional non-homologous end joining protein LigD